MQAPTYCKSTSTARNDNVKLATWKIIVVLKIMFSNLKKALEDGEQNEEVENFTLLNADGSVEAVLEEKMDNLLITSEAKVLLVYLGTCFWIMTSYFRMITFRMLQEMLLKVIGLVVAL